jgi:hypothetical protein
MFNEYGPGTLSDFLDVQGLSHGDAREYASARAKQPKKPLIASECCSCLTQRDENDAILNTKYSSFNADCLQAEVGLTDALPVLCLLLLLWKLTLCAMRYLTTLFGCSHFYAPPLTTTAYHHRHSTIYLALQISYACTHTAPLVRSRNNGLDTRRLSRRASSHRLAAS